MNWQRTKLTLFCYMAVAWVSAQVPRDTTYTVAATVAKVRKYYPTLDVQGVKPFQFESVQSSRIWYKWTGSRHLMANLFVPQKDSRHAAVIMVHGGGWRAGTPELMTPMAETLANAGYLVICPEYRMSLEAPYPAAVQDIQDAIKWVRHYTDSLHLPVHQMVMMGCSAGGQLATLVGTLVPVQAIVDVDGVLAFRHPDSEESAVAAEWLGGTSAEVPQIWEEASPLTHVSASTAPTLFLASKYPRFLAGHQEYMQKLKSFGTYSEIQKLDDAPHSFWLLSPWFEPTMTYTLDFLNKVL